MRTQSRLWIISIFTLFIFIHPSTVFADAESEKLEAIQTEIKGVSQNKKVLMLKKTALQKDLSKSESELIALGSRIRTHEINTKTYKNQLTQLASQAKQMQSTLDQKEREVEALVLAMIRMGRVPNEIIALQPDGILSSARGAMVMGSAVPELQNKLNQLANELSALEQVKRDIKTKQDDSAALRAELTSSRKKLLALTEKKKTELYNTNKNLVQHTVALKKLASDAKDIEDLMAKINLLKNVPRPKVSPRSKKSEAQYQTASLKPPPILTPAEKLQKRSKKREKPPKDTNLKDLALGLPAYGNIRISFGQVDDIGAKSKGWMITTSPSAIVTAPINGRIKYTGPFKRYGQIILIEHDNGYFSLIAGINKVFTVAEAYVRHGTPIGQMSDTPDSRGEYNLYYEVRYKGQPVNPKRLLSAKNL